MALVIPVLLVVLMGILEFGWLTKNQMTLSSAAREGARAAAVGKTTQEIEERIRRYASPINLTGSDGSVSMQVCDSIVSTCYAWPADNTTVVPPRNGVTPPNMIRITLTNRHRSLTGVIPRLTGRILTATVFIRREI